MSNRIVSKKELGFMGLVYFGAIIGAIILALLMSNRANAATSGQKHVMEKRDYWGATRQYSAPNAAGVGTHIESYIVSASVNYYFWNGAPDGVNRIAVKSVTVCYDRLTGNGSLFQGVAVNPYFDDDNDVVNPGYVYADDDGSDYNCGDYVIPAANRVWFRMDQDPGWSASGKVRIKFTNDDDFPFKFDGNTTKYFHPGDDYTVNDSLYIDGAYGGH